MKEPSIKEKLEEARSLYKDANADQRYMLESLFPELRESEDERVRKALIDFFIRGAENGEQTNGVYDKDILVWLEKQKVRSPLSKEEEYTLARIIEYLEDNDCPSEWKDLLYDVYALPYQKEHKSADMVEPKFHEGDIIKPKDGGHEPWQIMQVDISDKKYRFKDDYVIHFSEEDNYELVEQKPADKVKPKDYSSIDPHFLEFHKGDWIIFNGLTSFINEVVPGYYRTISVGGIPNSYDWDIDSIARLWTIDDAKDGDVLTTGSWTFIFKKYQDKSVYYHCAASEFNNFSISDTGEFFSNYVHPATEEQRDNLIKAMNDAGYRWNKEELKLEKIRND